MELLNLQNGSDIRGAAMGEHAVLTPDAVRRIGYSFGEWIKARSGIGARVAVGRDSRVTGSELSWYFAQGLCVERNKDSRLWPCQHAGHVYEHCEGGVHV